MGVGPVYSTRTPSGKYRPCVYVAVHSCLLYAEVGKGDLQAQSCFPSLGESVNKTQKLTSYGTGFQTFIAWNFITGLGAGGSVVVDKVS